MQGNRVTWFWCLCFVRYCLVGCSPGGGEESDTTERLHFPFSLSCIGEGNGNPLQCFCLENPWDGGAWWAAVSGVPQSRTRLKRLSSSRAALLSSLHVATKALLGEFCECHRACTFSPNIRSKCVENPLRRLHTMQK